MPETSHIVEARYVAGHVVWLRFRDGTSGEVDLAAALRGPVFEPLRDPAVFRQFQVHPEFHTLVWPNGADFAPEFLHGNVRVTV
jgi:hypothetical protein